MRFHSSREPYGIRWWLTLTERVTLRGEFYWWGLRCGFTFDRDDQGIGIAARFPPLALWLSLDGVGQTFNEPIEFSVSIHDWTIWFKPWGPSMSHSSRDPWWKRGVSLNLIDALLGRTKCSTVKGNPVEVFVPMPEGKYRAMAVVETRTWTRPRWFSHSRESVWLEIDGGIPHAGKGENSWDCGDDGLRGIGGETVEKAIGNAVASVLRDRRRYGMPSVGSMEHAK